MLIYLYTSRVMLKQLGVDDYGIYSVIGGLVAMFSLMSNALSTSISRFITFEIGKGNKEKLRRIFSTSVIIQFGISVIVLLIAEIVAMWFINEEMTIPEERVTAAIWVLQCSLFTFCINLIAVPYNACIIAHEHMTAFAYISIIDVLLKLGICLCLIIAPIDKLVFFSILMTVSALIIRFIYVYYCQKNFKKQKVNWYLIRVCLKRCWVFRDGAFLPILFMFLTIRELICSLMFFLVCQLTQPVD